jgi:hypothetical protein
MTRRLRSSWVLAAMTNLALVQCGGATFTGPDDGGGASGSSSGSSSTGESGSTSSTGTGGTGGSGSSSGVGDSGSVQGSGSLGFSGTDTSGATSGSSTGASTGSSSGSRSGSSSGGSGASSGSSSGSGSCPASEPPAGATCKDNGLDCEYGSNPDLSCNSLASCENNVWSYPDGTDPNCPINTCPVTYDRITPGGRCDTAGSSCAYPAGTCSCGSEGPPMISIDGGVGGPTWHCAPATAACPSPRPRIGTPCSGTQSCDYGACAGGIALMCTDGTWQESYVACPL